MKYVFRLATVLRVRRAEEMAARAGLVHANAVLVSAIEARELAEARYRAAGSTVTDVTALLEERCNSELAAGTLERAQRRVSRAASEAALAHVSWTGAAKRVRMLERLDDRRRVEHREEEGRREVAMIDDLVGARYPLGTGS